MTQTINQIKEFLKINEPIKDINSYIEIRRLLKKVRSLKSNYDFGLNKNQPETEDVNVLDFLESWKVFSIKFIPFELWSDICEEGLVLLKKLLEDPSIPYTELPGFKEFQDHIQEKYKWLDKNHPLYGERIGDMGY